MAAWDSGKMEAEEPATDDKWVFLQSNGDAAKGELLQDPDGEVLDEQESPANAAEGQESVQDTEEYIWWLRLAWNDASVHKALWYDMRSCVFIAALSLYTVLRVLATVASLAQCNAARALLISLEHFASAMSHTAVFSLGTRFASLMVVKASTMKKAPPELLSNVACIFVLMRVACIACIYEISTGIRVFHESRREEDFGWFLQLFADMARVHLLTAAIALSPWLVFLMGTDLVATCRAFVVHYKLMAKCRRLAAEWGPELRALQKQLLYIFIAACVICFGMTLANYVDFVFVIWSGLAANRSHADSAASGAI
ncbi:uncharacterized protein LOC142765095 [Rhipicephalus microplus]|uniref:uncharacterized protein LOC142765095 n=1 Tax=Rhipicephalus microplus TaxID=6941 RepID=UPI003F6AB7FE